MENEISVQDEYLLIRINSCILIDVERCCIRKFDTKILEYVFNDVKTETIGGMCIRRLRECFLFSPLEGHVERDSRKWLLRV